MKTKKINIYLYTLLSFIYMEFLFRYVLYHDLFRISNINMILYLMFISVIVVFFSKIFKSKVSKVLYIILLTICSVWFSAQFVVKDLFDFYISFSILQIAGQLGNGFMGQTFIEIFRRIVPILLFFLPTILAIILRNKLNFKHYSKKRYVIYVVSAIVTYGIFVLGLFIKKSDNYSPFELYFKVNSPDVNIQKMGIINTFTVDVKRLVLGFEEKIDFTPVNGEKNPHEPEQVKTYDYNHLNFDFEALLNETKDSTIKTITEYVSSIPGTKQNEYTGFFEGKNLILFMAESFNEIAVDPKVTPTLAKLTQNGFVFNNFYSQTIGSTLGGEFQELTGLYANDTSFPIIKSGKNSFPMGIANVFKALNYNTFAFHDHYHTFQNRHLYMPKYGFDNFKGCYNGLEKQINCHMWPESDVEMIDKTTEEYINSENPFMVFYASVSGHGDYTWTGNMMARKHKEEIESLNLGYSDKVLAYLATQMEFDKALELLIERLTEAGKLDDTVIVIAGDHYPYMLTLEEINEVSSYEKDGVIDINKSSLVIWNSKMDKVKVDKVASQMDILPTIYNLFKANYDSRLVIGNDILSTAPGIAMFGDRSWVSDYGKYFTSKSKFVLNEKETPEDYVSNMNKEVSTKIAISKYIMQKDYYKTLWNYLKPNEKPIDEVQEIIE